MAESQVSYAYDAAKIAALKTSFSETRFSTYLTKANGNEPYAFALYLYNSRLAKSFLFPLSVSEVTLRNAVDDTLVKQFGPNWHLHEGFRLTTLTEESLKALDKARDLAKSNDRGKVIAELTFGFWSNLFRVEYAEFWRTKANIAFPGLPRGEGRHEIQLLVKEINQLRNRVAHHEPLLGENAPDIHSKMIKLVKYRCEVTSDWMRHHSTVSVAIRSRPTASGFTSITVGNRSDSNFLSVDSKCSLASLSSRHGKFPAAFVCCVNDEVVGAFTYQNVVEHILQQAATLDGMIDLNVHSVEDIVQTPDVKNGFQTLSANAPLVAAIEVLKQTKMNLVVAVDDITRAPVGVILRAHRRY